MSRAYMTCLVNEALCIKSIIQHIHNYGCISTCCGNEYIFVQMCCWWKVLEQLPWHNPVINLHQHNCLTVFYPYSYYNWSDHVQSGLSILGNLLPAVRLWVQITEGVSIRDFKKVKHLFTPTLKCSRLVTHTHTHPWLFLAFIAR